jgi:hypothetical protein
MNAILFRIALTLVIKGLEFLRDRRKKMTPEERLTDDQQRKVNWVDNFKVGE